MSSLSLERIQLTNDLESRRLMAYHQAGHAFAVMRLRFSLVSVSIDEASGEGIEGSSIFGKTIYGEPAGRIGRFVYNRVTKSRRVRPEAEAEHVDRGRRARARALIAYAGILAEAMHNDGRRAVGLIRSGVDEDVAVAIEALRSLHPAAKPEELERLVRQAIRKIEQLLRRPRSANIVRGLAEALLAKSTLSSADARRIYRTGGITGFLP